MRMAISIKFEMQTLYGPLIEIIFEVELKKLRSPYAGNDIKTKLLFPLIFTSVQHPTPICIFYGLSLLLSFYKID